MVTTVAGNADAFMCQYKLIVKAVDTSLLVDFIYLFFRLLVDSLLGWSPLTQLHLPSGLRRRDLVEGKEKEERRRDANSSPFDWWRVGSMWGWKDAKGGGAI